MVPGWHDLLGPENPREFAGDAGKDWGREKKEKIP
jgi:hypothetical protein